MLTMVKREPASRASSDTLSEDAFGAAPEGPGAGPAHAAGGGGVESRVSDLGGQMAAGMTQNDAAGVATEWRPILEPPGGTPGRLDQLARLVVPAAAAAPGRNRPSDDQPVKKKRVRAPKPKASDDAAKKKRAKSGSFVDGETNSADKKKRVKTPVQGGIGVDGRASPAVTASSTAEAVECDRLLAELAELNTSSLSASEAHERLMALQRRAAVLEQQRRLVVRLPVRQSQVTAAQSPTPAAAPTTAPTPSPATAPPLPSATTPTAATPPPPAAALMHMASAASSQSPAPTPPTPAVSAGTARPPAAAPRRPLAPGEKPTICERCGKQCGSAVALSGHRRFCDGGLWRCDWCRCRADETNGKNPGPRGPATLCGACGSRYRAGHKGPVLANERGKYPCESCGKEMDSIAALGGHRRFCDGGAWRCDWCKCTATECSGKNPGPRGPATLCGACGSRYRAGHTGPPTIKDGKFECDACGKLMDSIGALGGHRRFCDGGSWRCAWCKCTATECSGKNPGPDGPATLCGACGSRYRAGHTGPPKRDGDKFICGDCGKALDSMIALGGHRRFCPGGSLWKCEWCDLGSQVKLPGPSGPNTLCSPCGARYEGGHDGPALIDGKGHFICDACGQKFPSWNALQEHTCDKTLACTLYEDGADWMGGTRASKRMPEIAPDAPVTAPLVLPAAPRLLLGGVARTDVAIAAWDLARHVARRVEGFVTAVDVEAVVRHQGTWWTRLHAGRIAPDDGWGWDQYEPGILGDEAPGFHGLYAAVTRALLRAAAADNEQHGGAAAKKRRKQRWQRINSTNWLAELATVYATEPVATIVRAAERRRQASATVEPANGKPAPPSAPARPGNPAAGKPPPPPTPSADLMSALSVAERLDLVASLADLLLGSSLMLEQVDEAMTLLANVAALKREAWQRRRTITLATANVVFDPTKRLVAAPAGARPRMLRLRLGGLAASKPDFLRSELNVQRRELDDQFAAVRALVPSYKRAPLGTDRDGRVYFMLGDVWDAVFVRDCKTEQWFALSPAETRALRASLCPHREAHLAMALDQILPSLLADPDSCEKNPKHLLRGPAIHHDDAYGTREEEACVVCGEPTSADDGSAMPQVLLCDHCDAEVHFSCSKLDKFPAENEPFTCPTCVAKLRAAKQKTARDSPSPSPLDRSDLDQPAAGGWNNLVAANADGRRTCTVILD